MVAPLYIVFLLPPTSVMCGGTVYSTEGATAVVPDRVTDIFMSAYKQLQAPQHKLGFFKLLVTEFGVQREHT